MASERLTTYMRERIVKDMLAYRFKDEIAALAAERGAFALSVYEDIYSATDRRKMAALPKGWLPTVNKIGASFGTTGSRYEELPFSGNCLGELYTSLPEVSRPVTDNNRYSCSKSYDGAHPLSARFHELDGKRVSLLEKFKLAKRQAEVAIAAASTTGRLKALWPEVAPFIAHFEKEPPNLPALPVANLNEMFRLPASIAAE